MGLEIETRYYEMRNNKILIVKRISNDFDRFVVRNLSTLDNDIDVMDVLKGNSKLMRKIIKIIKNTSLDILFPLCLKISSKSIKAYSQVIIFDDYPDDLLIKWIKKKNPKCSVKLWLWNVPNYSIEQLKDKCYIYCFDKLYAERHGIRFVEQFYFDDYVNGLDNKVIEQQICYIGYDKNRRELLDRLAEIFDKYSISYKFYLISDEVKESISEHYQIQRKPLKYSDVIEIDCKSEVIIEIVSGEQKGLTWRSLEALFLNKKMITNNVAVKKFDFYNRNNIFIINVDEFSELPSFLTQPITEIPSEIKKKYRAKSWLNDMMR